MGRLKSWKWTGENFRKIGKARKRGTGREMSERICVAARFIELCQTATGRVRSNWPSLLFDRSGRTNLKAIRRKQFDDVSVRRIVGSGKLHLTQIALQPSASLMLNGANVLDGWSGLSGRLSSSKRVHLAFTNIRQHARFILVLRRRSCAHCEWRLWLDGVQGRSENRWRSRRTDRTWWFTLNDRCRTTSVGSNGRTWSTERRWWDSRSSRSTRASSHCSGNSRRFCVSTSKSQSGRLIAIVHGSFWNVGRWIGGRRWRWRLRLDCIGCRMVATRNAGRFDWTIESITLCSSGRFTNRSICLCNADCRCCGCGCRKRWRCRWYVRIDWIWANIVSCAGSQYMIHFGVGHQLRFRCSVCKSMHRRRSVVRLTICLLKRWICFQGQSLFGRVFECCVWQHSRVGYGDSLQFVAVTVNCELRNKKWKVMISLQLFSKRIFHVSLTCNDMNVKWQKKQSKKERKK